MMGCIICSKTEQTQAQSVMSPSAATGSPAGQARDAGVGLVEAKSGVSKAPPVKEHAGLLGEQGQDEEEIGCGGMVGGEDLGSGGQ